MTRLRPNMVNAPHTTVRHMLATALFAVLLVALAGLAGCGGQVETDEASGMTDTQAPEDSQNLVNPTQLPDSSFIYDAPIADLSAASSYMEGQTVQVVGEVVGDRIAASFDPENCWITLQATDGSNSQISVYMPLSLTSIIDTYGAYGKRGTTIQVRGTFSVACTDHDGLLDIHADTVSLVSHGAVSPTPFSPMRFLPGIVLVLVGLALTLGYRYLSERRL